MNDSHHYLESFRSQELGIHFVLDTTHPNAFTWATVELILELHRAGIKISIPPNPIHKSIPKQQAVLLKKLMSSNQQNSFHVKWSHYWPHHMQAELKGNVNVDIICTNYRYRPAAAHHDLWARHIQLNHFRKLPVSGFNQDALVDLGFKPESCPVVPLGYSPEITALFPDGTVQDVTDSEPLNILVVTNSHDLYRYGTDIAIEALASTFDQQDNVIIHIKDYGHNEENRQLHEWLASHPSLPPIKWHTDFLTKEDLLKLYASMDFLLSPFRGEGFSMKIIDAMALGIPVMMPAFGGPMEYAPDGTFLPINHKEIPVGDCFDRQHLVLGDDVYWCECYCGHLSKQLRRAYNDRTWLKRIGANARAHVIPRFSWRNIANQWAQVLLSWHDEYKHTIEVRTHNDNYDISVIIPTKDRPDLLQKALTAYSKQSLESSRFELIINNDYGDYDCVKRVCDNFPVLPIHLLNNTGVPGPAGARNSGIEHARGRILLITGDDIIPCSEFLSIHLKAHTKKPDERAAFLGFSDWHPDINTTPFHHMLTGRGGYQFDFGGLEDSQTVDWGRFYTSNVSLKRSFIIKQEVLFSTNFPYAAFEDIEFAYRLHQHGMHMYFLRNAIGYHLHDITPETFVTRQKKAGAMLTLLTLMQPSAPIARENMRTLNLLEKECIEQPCSLPAEHTNPETLIEQLLAAYANVLALLSSSPPESAVYHWLSENHRNLWEAINRLCLQSGMVETWTQDQKTRDTALLYLQTITLPGLFSSDGLNKLFNNRSQPPDKEAGDINTVLFKNSPFIFHASHALRTCPVFGAFFRHLENCGVAQRTKNRVSRQLNKHTQ